MVKYQIGKWQHLLVARLLEGHFIVEVQDAPFEILAQGCTENLYVAGMLSHCGFIQISHGFRAAGICLCLLYGNIVQIRIVGDVFHSRFQLCAPPVYAQFSLNAGTHGL